jgi:hypothetical protein
MDANTLTAISIVVAAVPGWIFAYKGLKQGQSNGDQLADVHNAVNGGWAEVNDKLRSATDRLGTAVAEIALLKAELASRLK